MIVNTSNCSLIYKWLKLNNILLYYSSVKLAVFPIFPMLKASSSYKIFGQYWRIYKLYYLWQIIRIYSWSHVSVKPIHASLHGFNTCIQSQYMQQTAWNIMDYKLNLMSVQVSIINYMQHLIKAICECILTLVLVRNLPFLTQICFG